MIVAKFGGSSVKDASAMLSCVDVVKKTEGLGVVIISATYNTTNELEKVHSLIEEGKACDGIDLWEAIKDKHINIARDLDVGFLEDFKNFLIPLNLRLIEISRLKHVDSAHKDLILSFGEKMSSFLFHKALKKSFENERIVNLVMAEDFIKTDSCFGLASPMPEAIKLFSEGVFRRGFEAGELFVSQGFIGSDDHGQVTTLGREGSDYSATLLASALSASEVHIWTDVDGIYEVDPNKIPDAKRIPHLTFDEASIFARSGAKVLFSKTLQPLVSQSIPLKVGKTKNPDAGFTLIDNSLESDRDLIGIAIAKRTRGFILTIVGKGVHDLDIEQDEVDRTELSRSFFYSGDSSDEVLRLWYYRLFHP